MSKYAESDLQWVSSFYFLKWRSVLWSIRELTWEFLSLQLVPGRRDETARGGVPDAAGAGGLLCGAELDHELWRLHPLSVYETVS